jgi:cytochrome c-type protein NapB
MNKTFKLSLLAVVAIAVVACASSGPQVNSLRGKSANMADDNALQAKAYVGIRPGQTPLIARNFAAQPPLIPHTIENYEIGATENACWECHSSDDLKGKKMPMVGKSHLLVSTDPQAEPKLNMQRWQCDSCHVPQVDAQPLVDNVFQGLVSKK